MGPTNYGWADGPTQAAAAANGATAPFWVFILILAIAAGAVVAIVTHHRDWAAALAAIGSAVLYGVFGGFHLALQFTPIVFVLILFWIVWAVTRSNFTIIRLGDLRIDDWAFDALIVGLTLISTFPKHFGSDWGNPGWWALLWAWVSAKDVILAAFPTQDGTRYVLYMLGWGALLLLS